MVKNKERGQILLVIILVMVVTLTVGLSVVSRSITNVRISKEEASSQKALAAAEAGIEQVLKTSTSIPPGTSLASPADPNTTYGTSINAVSGNEILVLGNNNVPKDEGADIWLVGHNADGTPNLSSPWNGNLRIFWGLPTDVCDPDPAINTRAAIEIVVIYDVLSPKFKRYVYDPCASRRNNNNFLPSSAGATIATKLFSHSTSSISITSGLVARVIPLYSSSSIGVRANIALPSQGNIISSTGDSGGTKRKINVFKGYPQLPIQYFSYGLFSP